MPTVLHEAVVSWLLGLFRAFVVARGGRAYGSELRYAVSPRRGRKPDASVFLPGTPRPRATDRLVKHVPDIVVEVISSTPADERRDRIAKMNDYARFGVRHYWLVSPATRSVEMYELDPQGRYTRAAAASTKKLRAPGIDGLVLDLDALWREAYDE